MAAEQLPGRACACGCGASLDGRHENAVYTRECRERLKQDRDVARHRRKAAARREQKSIRPLASAVWRGTNNDARHVPAVKCSVCCDMPWARLSTRSVKDGDGGINAVADRHGNCRGCGGKYEPEPKPEHGSLIRSSAGTAQRASELWGYQPAFNSKNGEQMKVVREAKKAGNHGG